MQYRKINYFHRKSIVIIHFLFFKPIVHEIIEETNFQHHYVFLFVNKKSGAKQGLKILQHELDKVKLLKEDNLIRLHIIDVFEKQQKLKAFKNIKNLIGNDSLKRIIVCVCGGDGSLIYMAQEVRQYGIHLDQVLLCFLPFGTGNDLGRVLGWGVTPKKLWFSSLKSLAWDIIKG